MASSPLAIGTLAEQHSRRIFLHSGFWRKCGSICLRPWFTLFTALPHLTVGLSHSSDHLQRKLGRSGTANGRAFLAALLEDIILPF